MRILRATVDCWNGTLYEPNVKDGIPFWMVGENASHQFSIGYKDGQFYKSSIGEDVCPKCNGNGCLSEDNECVDCSNGMIWLTRIIKIYGDNWGYCGHH